MAAVTLKDLMDPLSKIQAAAEQTNEKLDALLAVSTGDTGGGLELAIVTQLEAQTEYLKIIADNSRGGGLSGFFGGRGNESKEATSAAEVLQQLGLGASSTAKGMLLWMLVPKKAVTKFIDFVQQAFTALAEQDSKKAEEGVNVLDAMGGAIKKFAGALALSALLIIPGLIAIPFLVLAIGLMAGSLALLGMAQKTIQKGSDALDGIGDAILSFAIGLAGFALVTMFILMQPMILLGMVGALLLVGGAVALLGFADKQVKKGSVALAVMGLGLGVFSLGYALFAFMTKDITLKQIGMQAAILIGVGLTTALLGFAFSYIIQGALSLAAMGIGLLVFGLGYTPFAEATKDTTMEDVGVQLALLLGLGLEFAAAGFGALFIIPGAAAFAAIGGALLLLAPGLEAIKKVDFTESDAMKLTTTLSGVKSAFLGTDGKDEGGVSGFFKKIGGAIGGAVDSVRMLSAAAGFAAAGASLSKLAVGLKDYKKLDWSDEDSLELTTVLSGITTAFAQAGGEPANPGGLFGAIFGNSFTPNATKRGIDSVMDAGKALTNIAEGLKAFQKLIESGVKFGEPDENGRYEDGTLGYAVTNTVGFINEAFAAVAEQGNVPAGGFFNTLFGIKKNKVAEGISSVKGAGKALKDIADGLMSFQDLINQGVKFGDTSDPENQYGGTDTLAYAVINTVGFVNEAFAAVADQGQAPKGGFFGSLFGIKENKVKVGIDAVKGAGAELKNIAEGLKTFQEMVEKEVDFSKGGKLSKAVTGSLGFVSDAFTAVASGNNVKKKSAFFGLIKYEENLVQKGIKKIKGAGSELNNIASALNTFDGLEDPEGLAQKVKNALTFVSDAFAAVGGKTDKKSASFFGFSISWNENLVKAGIKNVKGAGEELENIAAGLKSFEDLSDPVKVAQSISTLFESMSTVFADFYGNNPMFSFRMNNFSEFIVTIADAGEEGKLMNAADGMEAIANAVNSIDLDSAEAFGNLFKASAELQSNRRAYMALADAVQEIKDVLGGGEEEDGGGLPFPNPFKKKDDGPKNKGLSSTLKSINSTLGSLQSTMNRLPGAIQSIKIVVDD